MRAIREPGWPIRSIFPIDGLVSSRMKSVPKMLFPNRPSIYAFFGLLASIGMNLVWRDVGGGDKTAEICHSGGTLRVVPGDSGPETGAM